MDNEFRQRATLKEKLKTHYHSRNFTVQPQSASRAGLTWTGIMITSLFLEGVFILLPGVYGIQGEGEEARKGWFGEGYWLAMVVVVLTFVEVTWNWWRVYFDVPNFVRKETKTAYFGLTMETPTGWKSCPTCQLDAPPRSHHCNHCKRCILKRDHHCFFTGSCIGYYNQRHFVMFCSYVTWGCLLALYMQLSYLNIYLPISENLYTYIAPVTIVQLLTGNLRLWAFLLITHTYLTIVFMGIALFLLSWQLMIIMSGQTTYEAWKMIKIYDAGLWGNFTSVFGSPLWSWMLLFAPLMYPMESDGIKWNIKTKSEKGH